MPEEYKTITIDSKGRINVPLMLEVNDAIRIEVKATVESQPTLTASSSVFLVPIGSKGFIGFENGEIGYLDPNSEETSMKIIPKGNKKYETEKMIDLFEITSSTKKRA
ncbi:MAG: hypothetical protein MJ200_04125 [Mycoplasmoidaceae bacterium]|nr:hypothetical protein [Mycoplasmoidaceae bacterium]